MKSYVFKVVIEEDPFEDGKMAYHVYAPALEKYAASTWGHTKEEALKNIQELIEMIVEELIEDGEPLKDIIERQAQWMEDDLRRLGLIK